MVAGGSIATLSDAALNGTSLFRQAIASPYQALVVFTAGGTAGVNTNGLNVVQAGRNMLLDAGSLLNLSGASDIYDQVSVAPSNTLRASRYTSTPVWSDAGTLSAGAGLTLTGATIVAQGGAPQANGGTLIALDPLLAGRDPTAPTANVISADM